MRSKARARREVVDTSDMFIAETGGLTALELVPPLPQTTFLVGAIELSTKDHLLATATF